MKFTVKDKEKAPVYLVIFGTVIRIAVFIINLFIGGRNCDEVLTSLNAYSLADKLTDINGERLPMYFDNWVIGGQSPFSTYLTALSVKIFGENLFAVRLPALIFSIIGLIAIWRFAETVFTDKKHVIALIGFAAVCPWMIYSGAYVLDCNYLGHLIIIAFMFTAKALNTNKTRYYILACVFFSLGFYCYIASVLLLPFLLISLYLILLIKKKISIKNTVISVITVFTVALPFILWGLVVTGFLRDFTLFGFSFSAMPGYARGSDTAFVSDGASNIIITILTNLLSTLMLLVLNDYSALGLGSNLFGYGFLLTGVIGVLGFAKVVIDTVKKRTDLPFTAKLFAVSSLSGITAFCAFVNEPHLGSLYRYGVLSYLILIIVSIGFVELSRFLKIKKYERFLSIYLALSLLVFSGVFVFSYIPQVKTTSEASLEQENYGDPFFECLDFAEENGYDYVVIYKNPQIRMNTSAYARYYCYGKKDFYSIEDEIRLQNRHKDENGNYLVTTDGSIAYRWSGENNVIDNDFSIVQTEKLDELEFDKSVYSTKGYGFWTIV
nr:glycosyltransferase family 39 protein [Eubacterium sp.]